MSPYRAAPQPHSKRQPSPTMLRLANVGNARGWPQRATRFAMGCAVAFVLHACADVAQLDLLARLVSLTCVMMLLSGAMRIVAGYLRVLRVRVAMSRGRRMRPCGMCPLGSTARGPVATWPRCPSLRTHDRRERMWARNFEQ